MASLDLTGKWEFKEYPLSARRMRDLDSSDWQQTNVPCSIFSSLISTGTIKQTDIDTNPEKFQWVSEKPWVYRKIFDVPKELLDCDRIDLVFDGLDTISNIWLNDKLIGKTNNMFIPYVFDVTSVIKPKNNCLTVKFEPAVQYAKNLMSRYTSFSESDFRNPYRVYIRKAQYQFGWDFCPALPGCGIWRPVRLEGVKKAALADIYPRTIDCNQHYADIKVTVKLDVVKKEKFLCKLTLSGSEQTIEQELLFGAGETFHSAVIHLENPCLWHPAGYGQQHLYQITAQLMSGGEIIEQRQKRFGIRTVKLNCAADKQNEKFQFEINGQSIYAKGANWIPASIFAGAVSAADYQKLLDSASEAGINMLRVWGGGYYESDEFYELCDRSGIMVWQDFMFACGYYPDRQWFLEEIKKEAIAVVKRLRGHPCLVLWCGNNEIDRMHDSGKLGKGRKFHGRTIYHRILLELVAELDCDTAYIPTTPFYKKDKYKTVRQLTAHQWEIWSGHQPVQRYFCLPENIPPFVVEFGMQSLPDIETVKKFCPAEQMRTGSRILEKHNYQLDGNSLLYRYAGDLFGPVGSLEQFCYASQIMQARAAKTYVEYLRAHNHKNSGVLFWQYNDCCPAISWSASDCAQNPKALYYYAKRFFSNLLIAVAPNFEKRHFDSPAQLKSIDVVVVNDSGENVTATLNCRLVNLSGRLIDQMIFPVMAAPFSRTAHLKLPKAFIFPAEPEDCALHLSMTDKNGRQTAENLFFYLPDKYINWPDAKVNCRLMQLSAKRCKLTLKSNAVVRDVQILTAVPAQLSDNFINLICPYESEVTIDWGQSATDYESAIRLRSVKSALYSSSTLPTLPLFADHR